MDCTDPGTANQRPLCKLYSIMSSMRGDNHSKDHWHKDTFTPEARCWMCSQCRNKPCPAMRKAGRCHLISPARLTGCLLQLRLLQLQTVQQCCAEERYPRASTLACQLSQHLAVWTLCRYAFHRCAGSCCMSAYRCNARLGG